MHAHDYVVVPVRGGTLTVVDKSESRSYPIESGKSYARKKNGIEHNIVNHTNVEIFFIEIELKR